MKIRINKEKLFCAMTCMYVFATIIVDFFRKLGNEQSLEVIRNIIYIICFLYVIIHIYLNRKIKLDIIFLLIFPLQAFITLWITPEIKPVLSFFILYYFSRDFVGYYLFSRLCTPEIFKNSRWLLFIIALLYSMVIVLQGFRSDNYMLSSYNLIIPASILLIYGMKDFKIVYLFGGFISCLTILLYGARGALVCVGIAIILFMINDFFKEKISVGKVVLTACIIMGGVGVILNFNQILIRVYELTGSRTIRLILSGNIINGYGRAKTYNAFWNEITANPFVYRGILSDRILAAEMMNQPVSRGTYAHNIIFEIIYEYGIVLGTLILLFIFGCFGVCIYKIIKKNNRDLFILFISIFPAGFCSLFFSGSYLSTHYFWMLVGLTYNVLKGKFSNL
ncbi:MAG: O-antigen ligase family protein [Ruminococcus sp.]|nr:O-antigen ligase family protein [Ruminococcus sp.]